MPNVLLWLQAPIEGCTANSSPHSKVRLIASHSYMCICYEFTKNITPEPVFNMHSGWISAEKLAIVAKDPCGLPHFLYENTEIVLYHERRNSHHSQFFVQSHLHISCDQMLWYRNKDVYSEGPSFESWPKDQIPWLRILAVFLSPSRHSTLSMPWLSPNSTLIIIILSHLYYSPNKSGSSNEGKNGQVM